MYQVQTTIPTRERPRRRQGATAPIPARRRRKPDPVAYAAVLEVLG